MNRLPVVVLAAPLLAAASLATATGVGGGDAPPTTPEGLYARAYSATAGAIAWQRSMDDSGAVAGYEIVRDGAVLGVFDALSHVENELAAGRAYRYDVTAIDAAGQRSGTARLRVYTTGSGSIGPLAPGGLRSEVYSRTAAEIFWDRPDRFGLRYEVSRDGAPLTEIDGTSFFDDALSGGRPYVYEVIAVDRDGRRSGVAALMLTTPDGAPPAAAPIITVGNREAILDAVIAVIDGSLFRPIESAAERIGFRSDGDGLILLDTQSGDEDFTTDTYACVGGGGYIETSRSSATVIDRDGTATDCRIGDNVANGRLRSHSGREEPFHIVTEAFSIVRDEGTRESMSGSRSRLEGTTGIYRDDRDIVDYRGEDENGRPIVVTDAGIRIAFDPPPDDDPSAGDTGHRSTFSATVSARWTGDRPLVIETQGTTSAWTISWSDRYRLPRAPGA